MMSCLAQFSGLSDGLLHHTMSGLAGATTLMEPALIVGLGVVVAGIIISILVAIMQANQLAF